MTKLQSIDWEGLHDNLIQRYANGFDRLIKKIFWPLLMGGMAYFLGHIVVAVIKHWPEIH